MSRKSVCSAVASVARANDLPVPFFANLIWQESNFDSKSVSPAGAQGIAQFMPKTALEFGLLNPFDPIQALHAAGKFLSQLRAQFGNLGLAAAAYNAGPGRVVDYVSKRKALPGETRNYVLRITGRPADQWTKADIRHTPEARLMPARAPCVEVAEAVAHQSKAVRVTKLMSELAAAASGPAQDDSDDGASDRRVLVASVPHRGAKERGTARAALVNRRPAIAKAVLQTRPVIGAPVSKAVRLAEKKATHPAAERGTKSKADRKSGPQLASAAPKAAKSAKPAKAAKTAAAPARTHVASAH